MLGHTVSNAIYAIVTGAVGSSIITILDNVFSGQKEGLVKFVSVLAVMIIMYFVVYFVCRNYIIQAKGVVLYNTNIKASRFGFPYLFKNSYNTIFLVGPNQNFILNENNNKDNLLTLIESLSSHKKIHILISDIRQDKIKDMYVNVSAKNFSQECSEILSSITRLDQLIKENFGDNKLTQIKTDNSLEIKCIDLWLDSFCFVDGDDKRAKGYLAPVTKGTPGGSRPIYYFSKKHQQELFNFYYQIYISAYGDATKLWPN